MGKQTKNPSKIQKKNDAALKQQDSLTQQYSKFDKINYDSSDSESNNKPKAVQVIANKNNTAKALPIIDQQNNLEYMINNQIDSYMTNSQGMHIGMGKPLTQAEYDALHNK